MTTKCLSREFYYIHSYLIKVCFFWRLGAVDITWLLLEGFCSQNRGKSCQSTDSLGHSVLLAWHLQKKKKNSLQPRCVFFFFETSLAASFYKDRDLVVHGRVPACLNFRASGVHGCCKYPPDQDNSGAVHNYTL